MATVTVQQALEMALDQLRRGRFADATKILREVIACEPDEPNALHLCGVAAYQSGDDDAAVEWFGKAVAVCPQSAEFRNNHGLALHRLGRLAEAVAEFRRVLVLAPDLPEAHNNLGNTLNELGEHGAAAAACRAALARRPFFAQAHYNLGNALKYSGDWNAAVAAFRAALEIQPSYPAALMNLGNTLKDQGDVETAITCFRRALEFDPANAGLHSNLVYSLQFSNAAGQAELSAEQQRWNAHHAAPLAFAVREHPNDCDRDRRLKVGYVSPDFWDQAECYFVLPLLEAHDRAQVEVFCYADERKRDAVTERYQRCADVWRNTVHLRDDELAARIREDRIDILVDLTMHMRHHRLLVFARKPAPVQISWLAYPGSTGLQTIDYRLTDACLESPSSDEPTGTGQPLHLPDSWCCYEPVGGAPEVSPLPASAAGVVTFGSLNNPCKLNDAVLLRWSRVVTAVKNSRLLLLCPEGSPRERVTGILSSQGVARERVEFLSNQSRHEYLRAYSRIDLALDPIPYNGITTTCDALWMGVPVLSLPGDLPASRAGLSLLTAAGLSAELVATTENEYLQKAIALASDLQALAEMRATLRPRIAASPLMDAPRFARNVEAAYRQAWHRWCAKSARVSEPRHGTLHAGANVV